MKALGWFTTALNKLVVYVTAVMFILMTAFVVIQVFSRYVTNVSVPWTEEYARYLFVYIVLLGSSIAVKARGHVAVGMLADRLKGRANYVVSLFATLASAGFFLVMVYGGYYSMLRAARQLSPATETNLGVVYAAAPIAGALMLLYSIEILLELICQGPPPVAEDTIESIAASE